jgi:hypothetical protein
MPSDELSKRAPRTARGSLYWEALREEVCMLKITTTTDGDYRRTVKLEGKLLAPWVEEVAGTCAGPDGALASVRLDLAGLRYLDPAGNRLLHDLLARGAVVVDCSDFVAELLKLEKPCR